MGNTIISSLLFQPPTPANELDYFGSSVATSTAAAVTSARSAHNDSSNQAVQKSKGHFVRGGGSHSSRQQPSQPSQPSQSQQVVTNPNSNEPTLHYIWLVSPTHPLPIPALHIQHSTSLRPSNTPSTNRYTLLYSHGNAEDIGLLAKFLTDISKLLQVDILVYDYTGYGVSVDRRAVLRFYAVWGGRLEEWRRWRRSQSRSRNGGAEMRQDEGTNNGVRYSMDVFMAPMVFAKTTADAASSGKETSSSASTSALNLPDNVYVCGDELDFIEDDATTIATASDNDHQYHHQRTTSSSGRSRRSSATSEPRDNSLLDIDDDYDNDDYDDYDDDMPSITATCYENSTMHGGDDYDDDTEDEVSLFTCGASCNEAVEHSSIVEGLEEEEYEEDESMMRDDPTSEFSASSSYRRHHHHHSSQSSSPRSISGGSTATATVMSSSSQRRNSSQRGRNRRGHPNRQISIRAPLTPKQRRRALLRKHKWTMPSPSEEQCYGDILLAYNYLLQIQEVPAKHVLLYGKSVGSGPTCWLAQRTCQSSSVGSSSKDEAYDASGGGGGGMMYEDVRDDGDVDYRDERVGGGGASVSVGGRSSAGGNNKSSLVGRSCDDDDAPGGVILHSPFLSVIRVVLDMGFTTVGDLFPNIDRVKDFTCPTYIIHGTQDEIVPYYHGQGLFNGLSDTSKAVPFWANGAGHNNIEMEMPTAYIKRLMQFVRQCDRLNYPAGELLRTRAFSSGSHGSGPKQRGGSSAHSQQELDSALHLPNNHHRKHTHTRQMMSSVSKQRKKKGHSNSPTMVVNTVNTTTPKRRQGGGGGRSRRNSNNSISMEQQQVMHHHHGKYHHHQQPQQQYQQHQHNHHQSARRDQYPSVVTNLSTDAAMCGIHEPSSVESKYYTQYLQQQQQQQQQQSSYY